MKVEKRKLSLSKLKPNPENPRTIKDEKFMELVRSLREFPEMLSIREIVVDENYIVLGGNKRYLALKDLKEKSAPVKIISGLSDKQKREFVIKDNLQHGDFDWDFLANEWDTSELENWGLEIENSEPIDIDEVAEIKEDVDFRIKCENISELEGLQSKLGVKTKAIDKNKFCEIVGL